MFYTIILNFIIVPSVVFSTRKVHTDCGVILLQEKAHTKKY